MMGGFEDQVQKQVLSAGKLFRIAYWKVNEGKGISPEGRES